MIADLTAGNLFTAGSLLVVVAAFVVTNRLQVRYLERFFNSHEERELAMIRDLTERVVASNLSNTIAHDALHFKANELAVQIARINGKIGNGAASN